MSDADRARKPLKDSRGVVATPWDSTTVALAVVDGTHRGHSTGVLVRAADGSCSVLWPDGSSDAAAMSRSQWRVHVGDRVYRTPIWRSSAPAARRLLQQHAEAIGRGATPEPVQAARALPTIARLRERLAMASGDEVSALEEAIRAREEVIALEKRAAMAEGIVEARDEAIGRLLQRVADTQGERDAAQAELAKPVAGPWAGVTRRWRQAAVGDPVTGAQTVCHVDHDGWVALRPWRGDPDIGAVTIASGPETGPDGERLADAAAAAAWRLL